MVRIAIPPIPSDPPKNKEEAAVRVGNESLKVLIDAQWKYGLTAIDIATIAWMNVTQFYKALAFESGNKDKMADDFMESAKRVEAMIRSDSMKFDWEKQLEDGR